jgi:hypothetical protein
MGRHAETTLRKGAGMSKNWREGFNGFTRDDLIDVIADYEADKKADQVDLARLRKALHDISVVGLLSDEPDGPRCRRMREIARKAMKGKGRKELGI